MADQDNSVVIHLPDDGIAKSANFGREGLEELVKSMLGSQVGRGIDRVILRSGRGGPASGAVNWMKTIWRRAC